MEMQTALDIYLNETPEVSISEHLHAISNTETTSDYHSHVSQSRSADIFNTGFVRSLSPPSEAHYLHIPPPSHCKEPHCSSQSSIASPAPSLDSRQLSVADSSICTDNDIVTRMQQAFHLEEGDNLPPRMLIVPSEADDSEFEVNLGTAAPAPAHDPSAQRRSCKPHLRCAFWFLGCRSAHRHEDRWLAHCNSHLKNRHDARSVRCQFCGRAFAGWNRWLRHIADHQREGDIDFKSYRADPDMLPRLWCSKILQDYEYLEVLHRGELKGTTRKYLVSHDPKLERRRLEERAWRARA